ncbi:MAG: caspase family protein [Bacteroidota bacterium]
MKNKHCITSLLILLTLALTTVKLVAQDKEADKLKADSSFTLWIKGVKLFKRNPDEAQQLMIQSQKIYPLPTQMIIHCMDEIKRWDNKEALSLLDSYISSLTKLEGKPILGVWDSLYGKSFKYEKISSIYLIAAKSQKSTYAFLSGNLSIAYNESFAFLSDNSSWTMDYTLGSYAIAMGNFKAAEIHLQALTKKLSQLKAPLKGRDVAKPSNLKLRFKLYEMEMGKVKPNAEELTPLIKSADPNVAAEANIFLGNLAAAESNVKDVTKRSSDYLYLTGLIALKQNDYTNAMNSFTRSLNYVRGPRQYLDASFASIEVINEVSKHHTYYKRAEAYIGLKDFVRAKQDYESALVYMPGYQPAIDGLARLEAKQETERVTDKAAPVIAVTEPSLSRGLKITASNKDVMVKGLASDPSGLKSVTINGIAVYTQENGNFWGNVPLTVGSNKVTIVATDFAGNKGEQIFEIERNDAPATVTANNEIKAIAEKPGRNFAVLIASQNYTDTTIPSLENPIQDAVKLKIALKTLYNFPDSNVITLYNPNISDFKKKFIELNEMIQPEDNLVIFYAGHGIWVEKEKKGFWLLTDAIRNDQNTWLPNKNVLEMISKLPARHTLLITDACFSGSVFKTRSLGADAPSQLKELDQKISRVAITSGNDSEVPDESVFMKYLVKALTENKEKYLTAQKMFINQIIEAVMMETKTEPRYGTLELAGHIGGDFIFSKK